MTSESGDNSQYLVTNSYLKLLVVTSRRVGKQQDIYNVHSQEICKHGEEKYVGTKLTVPRHSTTILA